MDVLREREVKDSLERQLQDEQKVRGEYKYKHDFTWNRNWRELFAERRIETPIYSNVTKVSKLLSTFHTLPVLRNLKNTLTVRTRDSQ